MAITDSEKVLMECLANVRSKYEIILIFFISIMDRKSLPSWISKPGDDIILDNPSKFIFRILLACTWFP